MGDIIDPNKPNLIKQKIQLKQGQKLNIPVEIKNLAPGESVVIIFELDYLGHLWEKDVGDFEFKLNITKIPNPSIIHPGYN